jgi:hypothetical protein
MEIDDDSRLLGILDEHPDPVNLSGYAHRIYDERLMKWNREVNFVLIAYSRKKGLMKYEYVMKCIKNARFILASFLSIKVETFLFFHSLLTIGVEGFLSVLG